MFQNFQQNIRENLAKFSFLTGSTIISFVFLNFAINTLGFFVKQPIGLFQFWLSIALCLILNIVLAFSFFTQRVVALLLSLLSLILVFGAVGGSLWVSNRFYDVSFDGQAYHQEAIIELKEGWNPVYERASTRHPIWLNAYPKSGWVNSATVFKLTSKIEWGKMFNLLILFAAFTIVLAALLSFKRLNVWWTLPITLAFVANPVTLYQLFNYYIDGQMYSVMLVLLATFTLMLNSTFENSSKQKYIYPGFFVMTGIYLINIKLVGLVFGLVFLSAMLIYTVLAKWKKLLLIGGSIIATVFLGFAVFGYNPYITNNIYNKSPLYPVLGKGAYNFRDENLPINFRNKNSLEVLLLSGFIESNSVRGDKDLGNLKVPFTYSDNEKVAMQSANIKEGGFGVYFGGAVVVVLAMLLAIVAYYSIRQRPFKDEQATNILKLKNGVFEFLVFSGVIVTVLVSSILNSASSYARFVPQLWAVPVIVLLYFALFKNKFVQAAAFVICAILLVNSYIVLTGSINGQINATDKVLDKLTVLQKNYTAEKPLIIDFGNATGSRERLKEFNIPFKEEKELTCKKQNPFPLYSNVSVACAKQQ